MVRIQIRTDIGSKPFAKVNKRQQKKLTLARKEIGMKIGKQFSLMSEYLGSAWNSEGRKRHIVSVSSSRTPYLLLKEKLTPLGFSII